jgi:hypothetical protein
MSLPTRSTPRKASRVIAIGDRKFRWVASGNDDGIRVTIELLPSPGKKLFTVFPYELKSVTPRHVRAAVESALLRGWEPIQADWDGFSDHATAL